MVSVNARVCAEALFSARDITILIHANPDGDCVGSGVALTSALLRLGKNARLLCADTLPERLGFIAANVNYDSLFFGRDTEAASGLIISVDTASPELLGSLREKYQDKIEICIDHHLVNTIDCESMLRDSTASACGEIILELLDELSSISGAALIDKDIALMLYAAISSDSGSFKYSNTTAKTLLYASRLKSLGADSERISKLLFDTMPLSQFRLMGALIGKTEFLRDGKIAFCAVLESDLEECGATREDIDGLVQIFRQVEGVELSILAKERREGDKTVFKMSLRSNGDTNCAEICSRFGGGGHAKAAGCTVEGELDVAKGKIIEAIDDRGN